jgi:tRNA nucleotidyltransferase (CCA-adding enzyme)
LRYPATQVKAVLSACHLWKDLPWVATAKLSMIANRLEDVPPLAIYANSLAARDDKLCNNLQAYLDRLNTITPRITGDDLRERGLIPGPIYKRVLSAIRDGWLDGKIENVDQEEAYLNELIRNDPSFHTTS